MVSKSNPPSKLRKDKLGALTPWGTLCHGPSFARQRRRWHCLPCIDHTDCRHHTVGVSASETDAVVTLVNSNCLPWTFLIYSDHMPCRPSCEHYRNVSGLMLVLNGGLSLCIIYYVVVFPLFILLSIVVECMVEDRQSV